MSWEDADRALLAVGECRQALARIEAETEGEVEKLKAAAKAKAAAYVERLAWGESALEDFTKEHQTELDGRSKRVTHGRVGFRSVTKIVLKRSAQFVLGVLLAKKMGDCIRVKTEVDKEALDRYPDLVLAEVGCARKTSDTFFVEPDEVKL